LLPIFGQHVLRFARQLQEIAMELNQIEIAVVTKTLDQADQAILADLTDLQLALVGGGIADVVVA
jgi:hypothetical protein